MLIYLDCCCLNRPFDDRRQDRVRIEAEAVEAILSHIASGTLSLVSSAALAFEVSRTPDPLRRMACLETISRPARFVESTREVRLLTAQLVGLGVKDLDAAHLASAQVGGAGAFLTVDDRLLQSCRRIGNILTLHSTCPVEFLLHREGRKLR